MEDVTMAFFSKKKTKDSAGSSLDKPCKYPIFCPVMALKDMVISLKLGASYRNCRLSFCCQLYKMSRLKELFGSNTTKK